MCGNCKGKKCFGLKITKWLLIIGGINWGVLGLGMLLGKMDSWNLVNMIFKSMPSIEAIIYVLVGIAAIMKIFGCRCKKCCKCAGGVCPADGKTEEKI
jgi:uncharacterized membrane protein YuzA (DUF378 family)